MLISDSDLEGVESGDGPLNWFEPFRALKPVTTIQHGIYVYQGRFAVPLMSALVDVRRTGDLLEQNQPAAALEMAQGAVALAPDSAITPTQSRGHPRGLCALERSLGALQASRRTGTHHPARA